MQENTRWKMLIFLRIVGNFPPMREFLKARLIVQSRKVKMDTLENANAKSCLKSRLEPKNMQENTL